MLVNETTGAGAPADVAPLGEASASRWLNALADALPEPTRSSAASSTSCASEAPLSPRTQQLLQRLRFDREPRLHRANSTSTVYVRSSMQHPDRVATISAVAERIFIHVATGDAAVAIDPTLAAACPALFDEFRYRPPQAQRSKVDTEYIFNFICHIFVNAQMADACDVPIAALIYLERLIAGGLVMRRNTWKPLTLTALIIGSKVWDDESMWNRSFAKIYPVFTLRDINRMEAAMLGMLQYRVGITATEYTKHFFDLQDAARCSPGPAGAGASGARSRPAARVPLSRERAEKLEYLSTDREAQLLRATSMKRHASSTALLKSTVTRRLVV